jgi:hypothetical protein
MPRAKRNGDKAMQYAILCYHVENVVTAWTKEHDDAVMEKIFAVMDRKAKQGKLGPAARLLPTTAATTLKTDREKPLVIDGPFAETKEQLLGFYIVNADSLDEVLDFAPELAEVNPGGTYEVRPVGLYVPGEATG